jgi:hypothetical protein
MGRKSDSESTQCYLVKVSDHDQDSVCFVQSLPRCRHSTSFQMFLEPPILLTTLQSKGSARNPDVLVSLG